MCLGVGGDSLARANAAVGLARNGVADAADALIELLDENLAEIDRDDFSKLSEEDQQEELRSRQFVRPTLLRNCIRASGGVYGSMSDAQKELLLPLLKAASEDSDASVSVEADTLQKMLESINSVEGVNDVHQTRTEHDAGHGPDGP